MVVDTEWEPRNEGEAAEECSRMSSKNKREREERREKKRAKLDNDEGVVWGVEVS